MLTDQGRIHMAEEAIAWHRDSIRALEAEIDAIRNKARCQGYDEGGFRCELSKGHEGEHFVEYMGS